MMKQAAILPEAVLKAFETVPDLYLILSPELTILTASDAYLQATLTTREAIRGKYVFEAFPDNPATPAAKATDNLLASLQLVLSTKAPHQMALQHYDVPLPSAARGFAEKYWLPLNTPVLDEEGRVRYLIHKVEEVTRQQQAEADLREEHRRLKEAQAIGHIGSFEWTLGSDTVSWSDELYRINGLEPQSKVLRLEETDQFIHPEDLPALQAVKQQSFQKPGSYRHEHRVIRADGVVRWVNHAFESLPDRAGNVVRFRGIVQDITDHKQARQAIEQKQELLKAIMDSSLDMIQVFSAVRNQRGEIVDFTWLVNNHAAEKIYGDVIGKSLLASNPGVKQEGIFDAFKQVVETGIPGVSERHYAHEQFSGWFQQSVVKLNDGVVTTTTEITGRKTTEQQLLRAKEELAKQATEKYHGLLASIEQGFCTISVRYDAHDQPTDYQFLEVSPSFEHQTGIKDGAGRWMRQIAPDHEAFWFETYGRIAKDRKAERFESMSTPLGRWWSVYAFPIDAPEQRRVGVLFNDITERKTREQQQAFLLRFSDTLRADSDVDAVANQALQMLAEQLRLDRCYVGVYQLADDHGAFPYQVGNDRVPPMPGSVRLSDFPDALQVAFHRTLVIEDVAKAAGLTDTDRKNLGALGLGALVAASLRRGEANPVWSIVAVSASPRPWTVSEVELIEEVTERTWAALERVKADETLRKSEEQFRRALKEAPIPVIMHAEDGEVLQISRTWTELTGYLPEEVPTFEAWLTEAYGEGANAVRNHMHQLFAGKLRTLNLDFPVRTRQGELRHWSFSASSPGMLSDGRRFIVGMAVDITERKQAQEQLQAFNLRLERQVAERTRALKESHDLLQSVFDTTLFSMVVLKAQRDQGGAITDFGIRVVNRQLEKLTDRTDLVGNLVGELYPGFRETGLFDLMRQVMETGEPAQTEHYYEHEGFDAWFKSMFVKMDDGLLATNLDITGRKRAEIENKNHLQLLKQAEEVTHMGSWVYDVSSRQFTWSEGMYRLFGLPAGSPIRPGIYLDYVIDEDRPVAEKIIHCLRVGLEPLEETLRIAVEGKELTLKIKAIVMHDERGKPLKVLGVDLDISELKRLEGENLSMRLEQQQALLNAILEAQEEERRRISESLHNGVGQILYATKLNLAGVNLDALPARKPEMEASLQKTYALLTEAIVETRRVSHELVPVLLKDFGLRKAVEEFCSRFQGTGIQLDCYCFPERLPLSLETALYRMAQELVNNIVKHSRATRARLELMRDKDVVYLEAQDNGRGMNDNRQRGEKPRQGIGMRTIRDRVELLGGSVAVDSTPGKGTLVTISLPLKKGT